jgi:hypothetical protein
MVPTRWVCSGLLIFLMVTASAGPPAAPQPDKDTAQIDRGQAKGEKSTLSPELTFRARILAIAPSKDVKINWRYGGEGLGGLVYSGTLAKGLPVGQWSDSTPLASLVKGSWPPAYQGRYWYITFTVNDSKSRGLKMEFEFSYKGKALKTFEVDGPDGATAGIVVPHWRLANGREPTDAQFVAELTGLKEYAKRRADTLLSLPWAKGPLPKKFLFATDLGGYGVGSAYGVRHSDPAVVEAELPTLRQLGVNTLRKTPDFLMEWAKKGDKRAEGIGAGEISSAMGFPVPPYRKGHENDPEAGCPFGTKVPELTQAQVKAAVERNLKLGVPEVWALTIDEIGSVFDQTPEGKKHVETCPRCIAAFRQYVREQGATPADFGQAGWSTVKPILEGGTKATSYYTRKFGNYATARLFTELVKAFDQENAKKRDALARGDKESAAAKQPWVYSYALRGNTFLMGGHSLDFFDFYRYSDNAFMYEMSNRGWQVWHWDSYLCDVGRVVGREMNKPLGVYVKPHRGAPVQRALTAVARGARMIYWYTYGPDYSKGDSFSDNLENVALASKAAHLIGKSEDVLWGSTWAKQPEVAIVKPRCSELLGNDAQWENAKWVYTALAHAHVPVDPIDEVMLANDDLSHYKAIYVNGSHLPRKSALGLAKYVESGGVLWTSGWGCARDEADEPLTTLAPVLGLGDRGDPELWYKVQRYGATAVQSFTDAKSALSPVPKEARIKGEGKYASDFQPVIGREVLKPTADTAVLARFADGSAAATVHAYGKGKAYVVGFYPGLEYSAMVRDGKVDLSRDYDPSRASFITAPALDITQPPVEVSIPTVEAVLLRSPSSGKHAVVLMNWSYALDGTARLVELTGLEITVHGTPSATRATSAMLDKTIPIRKEGDAIRLTLPQLQEGDVITLE